MSPVDACLAELGKRLDASLPKDSAEARLKEARGHLKEAVRLEGEAAALTRFGPPAANARAIVRQARGYGSRGAGPLSWAVGLALGGAILVAYVATERTGTMAAYRAGTALPFLAALAFGVRCLQTRRWLALPVLAWGALAHALCILLAAGVPARIAPTGRAAAVEEARGALAAWDARAREVAEWRAGRTPEHTAISPWRSPVTWYVAGLPFGVPWGSDLHYDAQTFANRLYEPERDWARYGQPWARTVAERRRGAAEVLAAAQTGLLAPREAAPVWAGRWLLGVAQLAAVLFAYNALALLLGRMADALPGRGRTAAA